MAAGEPLHVTIAPAQTGERLDRALVAALAHVALLASFVVPRGFFALQGQVITVIPALLWAWILAAGVALIRARGRHAPTSRPA